MRRYGRIVADLLTETLLETPVFDVQGFPVETRVGSKQFVRLRMPDWVNVVAVTEGGQLLVVKQHRWGLDAETLEIVGGVVDPGEEPAETARRELMEETGYGGGTWRSLGFVHPNPAIQDNRCWLFEVLGVRKMAEQALDPGEDIEVVLVSLAQARDLVLSGGISHVLSVVTLMRHLDSP